MLSTVVGWLVIAVLIVGALRLGIALLPRWIVLGVGVLLALQLLHPQAIRHVVGAAVFSSVLEPVLGLTFVLLGLWIIFVKGFGIGRKR